MVVLVLVIAVSVVGALLVYRPTLGQMAEAPAAPQVEQASDRSNLRPLPMTGAAIPSSTIPDVVAPLEAPTVVPPTRPPWAIPTVMPAPPTSVPAHIPPHLRHLSEKEYMLELINIERQRAGVSAVALGTNNAAQLHAESALANCFSSHWGIDGLKPYHRYNLAGGYQTNGENGSGRDYCIKASDGYAPIASIQEEIREAIAGWMKSPGHRRNLLKPFHRQVNIGIAWDRHNQAMFQHFEGDYVEYEQPPSLAGGVLSLTGKVKNGVRFDNARDLGVQVFYDPPPHPLTLGQLSRTYCYNTGIPAAALRKSLTGRSYYPSDQGTITVSTCPDPYAVPSDAPAAKSESDAHRLWQQAYDASTTPQTVSYQFVTADRWTATGSTFSIRANLSGLLEKHGDGIYSVVVWGKMKGEERAISMLSFFQGVTPPETYSPAQWP